MAVDLERVFGVLRTTPGVLRAFLQDLPETLVRSTEGGETWSPFDVVGHLIHGERTDWIPRLKITLADDPGTYEPFDRFAQFEASKGRSLAELLAEFEALRAANLAKLQALKLVEADFGRTATHPELGTVTVSELLATWAAHDLGHIAQIARVLARTFGDEVGPWREYLPVLHPRASGQR